MTKYVKETIINFNEGEEVATVYTYNGAMKTKLAKFSAAYPDLCKITHQDKTGAVTYEVDKRRISINLKRPLTEQEKERARARVCNISNKP